MRRYFRVAIAAFAIGSCAFAQASPLVETIAYQGTQIGRVSTLLHYRRGVPEAALDRTQSSIREYPRAFYVELTFSGSAVTGRYHATGGLKPGTLSGTRSGDLCDLRDGATGGIWTGRCDAETFSGKYASPPGGAALVSIRFRTVATTASDATAHVEPNRVDSLPLFGQPDRPAPQRTVDAGERDQYVEKILKYSEKAGERLTRVKASSLTSASITLYLSKASILIRAPKATEASMDRAIAYASMAVDIEKLTNDRVYHQRIQSVLAAAWSRHADLDGFMNSLPVKSGSGLSPQCGIDGHDSQGPC